MRYARTYTGDLGDAYFRDANTWSLHYGRGFLLVTWPGWDLATTQLNVLVDVRVRCV